MTREEIIECYSEAVYSTGLAAAAGNENAMRDYELFKAGFDALRGPTREQVEKMKTRVDDVSDDDPLCEYGRCLACESYVVVEDNFCSVCGSPFTDKAVDILAKRLEDVLKDGN